MNKRMRELLNQIENKTKEAEGYMAAENKDVAKAKEIMDEVKALKAEYEVEADLYEMTKNAPAVAPKTEPKEEDSVAKFAKAARAGFPKSMTEGSAVDGGYTVPEDIQTTINELKMAKKSALHLVKVSKVSTNKGSRTFKKRVQQTGFVKVGEGSKIGAKATPQFTRVDYEISKYAGYFPVTNELLADSDANIVSVLTDWIANESRVTANTLIFGALDKKDAVAMAGLDDIKKALNVTLGQAFKATAKIVTNDDGLQYLDTLKDEKGNYLLQPNPADPMKLQLCAGSSVVPVEVFPNSDLPTVESKIPFYIGDLAEAIEFFDRQQLTITTSGEAAVGALNAFEEDLTIYRAIEREDVQVRDDGAYVRGYINVA